GEAIRLVCQIEPLGDLGEGGVDQVIDVGLTDRGRPRSGCPCCALSVCLRCYYRWKTSNDAVLGCVMKVVLFCGGLGTRIREYSEAIPKPMIPVGQQPILWHVMQYYKHYGHRDFVLCLGYKGSIIKDFFLNWRQESFSDCVISDAGRKVE